MAEALGVSIATVDRGIKELREKIGLRVKRRGFGRTNCYLIPDLLESSKMNTSEEVGRITLEKTELKTIEEAGMKSIIDDPNRNINNKYTEVNDKESSSVKEIFHYFREVVGDTKGFDPEICWGKDGRLVKLRLRKYSPEEIKSLIDWYLGSEVSERLGISLATCLSTYVINLWKASKSRTSYLDKIYPAWQMKN